MTNISFLTLEDINGVLFNNQDFYWHTIDTSNISTNSDYSDVVIDFCRVSRTTLSNGRYRYTVKIDSTDFTKGYYTINRAGAGEIINNSLVFISYDPSVKIVLYMGNLSLSDIYVMYYVLKNEKINLTLKELSQTQTIEYIDILNETELSLSQTVNEGYNLIQDNYNKPIGYLLVTLLKSDFQFNCTQSLVLGKVNTVSLGVDTDYKPNGEMIGTNTPNIRVLYGSTYIPVRFDSTVNDYVFDIDLTTKQNEGKLRLKVFVEANDVLNATETDIALNTSFEIINNETKLQTLFDNGGIGRLGSNITLTKDITVENSVLLLGNIKTLNMNNHKIIVPSERTFKATETIFTNGKNTIQQNVGSTVELIACGFSDCNGFGSVIDCQTDLSSLSVENDFVTTITNCVFSNNDMCILHGGELNITGCEINGKIGNPNNPYFLYQTDGNATILQSTFNLSSDTQISTDIEFNSCIFTCGETAIVNGNSHDELHNNNINSFISNPQNNSSIINVTYYYPAIEDYITLQSDNGYCHSCSNVDFVFKNNVTARRD